MPDALGRLTTSLSKQPSVACGLEHDGVIKKESKHWDRKQPTHTSTYVPAARQAGPSAAVEGQAIHALLQPGQKPDAAAILNQVNAAAQNGSLDDLVEQLRSFGHLRQVGDATARAGAAENSKLAEALAKQVSGPRLALLSEQLQDSKSPISRLLPGAIEKNSGPKEKVDFIGAMVSRGLKTSTDRLAVAGALAGLRGPPAGQAWAYLSSSPNAINTIVGEVAKLNATLPASMINLPATYRTPELLKNLTLSAQYADGGPKAQAFSAVAGQLEMLDADADRNVLLDRMVDLVKADPSDITKHLRNQPESGKAVSQFAEAMLGSEPGWFAKTTPAEFATHQRVKQMGEIFDQLRQGPGPNASAGAWLNAFMCTEVPSADAASSEFDNAKNLGHWVGATNGALRKIAGSTRNDALLGLLETATGVSMTKDIWSNAWATKDGKRVGTVGPAGKQGIGVGATALTFMAALAFRNKISTAAGDTRTLSGLLSESSLDPTAEASSSKRPLREEALQAFTVELLRAENVVTHRMD